ncbi:MAG: Holliday junction branch migration protein RuvA [Oscillospiraceae bacterium]
MFYYLEGTVTIIEHSLVVIDVSGAGYRCYTTMNTLSYLEIGKKARLYTYCNIREDAFDIYGFHDMNEKRCFELLLGVSGVGPKAALSILSANSPEALAMAVITDNEKALTSAQGIGKRLAQRIILELKDKVAKENIPVKGTAITSSGVQGASGSKGEAAAAGLSVLGYTQSEISAALRGIDTEALAVEEIIREVLKNSLK